MLIHKQEFRQAKLRVYGPRKLNVLCTSGGVIKFLEVTSLVGVALEKHRPSYDEDFAYYTARICRDCSPVHDGTKFYIRFSEKNDVSDMFIGLARSKSARARAIAISQITTQLD